jgi:asparagine synthase (glutamine-hydrolysing)
MCGIAGIVALHPDLDLTADVLAMTAKLSHRGPDDGDSWSDPEHGVALGHRRLSILDLSPAGRQPMHSASGRYVVTFNGEIYNHIELRGMLEREGLIHAWRGRSDTETLLAAFEAWSPETALRRAVGMFALAAWDRWTRRLLLARDRLGEKPLYYGRQGNRLTFASELKALRVERGFDGTINRQALALFLRHNYVPSPWSIYEGIYKLPAGHYLWISRDRLDGAPLPYWSAQDACNAGAAEPFEGSVKEAEEALTAFLKAAIAGQMVADVPVGAFLSGGIDSTLIVALMQAQSVRPVKTFTIGFDEAAFDEARFAAQAARVLGTDHTELYVSPQRAMSVIPELPRIYDEPFADSSQIPTVLVSRLAREQVTVSLSGDGGDELFGGYTRYNHGLRAWRRLRATPDWIRRAVIGGIERVPVHYWNHLYTWMRWMVPADWEQSNPGDKLRKLAAALRLVSPEALYLELISHWRDPESVVINGEEPPTLQRAGAIGLHARGFIERMMYLDLVTYLPDDILCKVDRAAMSVSLETRVPFLDHRVVEFAWRLPIDYRFAGGIGKRILRSILARHVPQELFERPKMGFGIPIQSWLRGALRDWAESLLTESRLRADGYFRAARIRQTWNEHVSGQRDWGYHLWDVLMFQAWLDEQRKAA